MASKYVIYKLRSDGSFLWIEVIEDILTAKQRLEILSAEEPGDYHLWDTSLHTFVNAFAKSVARPSVLKAIYGGTVCFT
jgi:hypothetical protein